MARIAPFREFALESPLPAAEVINRLVVRVEDKWRHSERDHGFFEGRVDGDGFTVERIFDWFQPAPSGVFIRFGSRQSMVPRVRGRVESRPDGGCRVSGTVRLKSTTLALATGLLLADLVVSLGLATTNPFDWAYFVPTAALVFAGVGVVSNFNREADAAINELSEIAEAIGPGPGGVRQGSR